MDFLLATDLLARGLDIHGVNAVINFQFPREVSRYTHRIGRTARAGEAGVALTICDEDERKLLKKISRKEGQALTYSVQLKTVDKMKQSILEVRPRL